MAPCTALTARAQSGLRRYVVQVDLALARGKLLQAARAACFARRAGPDDTDAFQRAMRVCAAAASRPTDGAGSAVVEEVLREVIASVRAGRARAPLSPLRAHTGA